MQQVRSEIQKFQIDKIIQRLLYQGVEKAHPNYQSYIRQSNLNGLIFFVMDLVLAALIFLTLRDKHISLGLVVAAFAFLISSIGFNRMGWTTLSRLSTVNIGTVLVTYCSFYLGADSFAACSLLLGAVFPFVYFSSTERKEILFCVLFPIVAFICLIATDYQLGPQFVFQNPTSLKVMQLIFFLVPLIGIVSNSYTAVKEREQKNAELDESKRHLEMIFNALSHDMANPIQTISMLSRLGMESKLNPDRLLSLHSSSQHLVRIFTKLMKVSKLGNGKTKLLMKPCSVQEVFSETIKFSSHLSNKKNVKVHMQASPDLFVLADKDLLVFQVMTNFLTNAIKFSPPQSNIYISASTDQEKVVISIRDEGVGIESDKLMRLFSWREETSTTGTEGESGTGLGLPLALKFLQGMNGKLEVHSRTKINHPTDHGTEIKIFLQHFVSLSKTPNLTRIS